MKLVRHLGAVFDAGITLDWRHQTRLGQCRREVYLGRVGAVIYSADDVDYPISAVIFCSRLAVDDYHCREYGTGNAELCPHFYARQSC